MGLAIWLKLLPVMGAGYLLLKGKWRPAVIAILLAVAIDCALSVAAFGWRGAWDEHLRWADWGAAGSIERQMHGDTYINEDRITNQSLIVVLRRFLTARAGYPQLAMADLSPKALSIVTGCAFLALGAVVLRAIRRPAHTLAPGDWAVEIALVVLCTVWFSPVVWSYHLTAALPALAVVMAGSDESRKRAVSLVWLAGVALFAVPLARAAGHMLWASLFLGALLCCRRDTLFSDQHCAISLATRPDFLALTHELRPPAHRKRSPPRSILSQSKLHGLLIRQTRAILC